MGRAGSGRSGGGSSGGGHSFSRSSGGHRMGSSRSGSSSSSRSGSSSFSFSPLRSRTSSYDRGRSYNSPSHNHGHYDNYDDIHVSHHYHDGNSVSSILSTIIVGIIVIAVLVLAFSASSASTQSTIERYKLTDVKAFDNDCVIDELGWVDNVSKTGAGLKAFWEKTGVQPFIYFKAYDPALKTDKQKEDFCTNYYDTNFSQENVFLYVYFCEPNEDDVGYMAYANGYQTSSIMDSEALEIFWNYIDRYWYTDMSTDDMLTTVFEKTGNTIMEVSTTSKDLVKYLIVGVAVIVVLVVVFKIIVFRRKAEKERAEETERILNSPVEQLSSQDSADALAEKYQ